MQSLTGAVVCLILSLPAIASAQDAPDETSAIGLSLSYVAGITAVVDGGLQQRGTFLDNLNIGADLDLHALTGWRGAIAHVDLLNNSGGIPNDFAGTAQGIDNIEVAAQRLRLFEAWIEQSLAPDLSLRFGLYDLNSEFYTNDSAGYLIAPAFGIGSEIAETGPNGPSIFPSTALGARVQKRFAEDFYLRAAVLNANAGVLGDPGGVNLSFDAGSLLITEGGMERDQKFALGAWRYTRRQDDLREVDASGAAVKRVAYGAYVVLEQPLTPVDGLLPVRAFLRVGVSDGKTTQFRSGWQAGFLMEQVFEGRPESVLSLGVSQGAFSDAFRRNEADIGSTIDETELQVELTYSDRLFSNLTIQPDLQWVRRPGGDASVKDAVIAGLRLSFGL